MNNPHKPVVQDLKLPWLGLTKVWKILTQTTTRRNENQEERDGDLLLYRVRRADLFVPVEQ